MRSLASLLFVHETPTPKVDQLQGRLVHLVLEHDVLWLDVAVHDVVGVAEVHGAQELVADPRQIPERNLSRPLRAQVREQVPAGAELRHDENLRRRLENAVEIHHILLPLCVNRTKRRVRIGERFR